MKAPLSLRDCSYGKAQTLVAIQMESTRILSCAALTVGGVYRAVKCGQVSFARVFLIGLLSSAGTVLLEVKVMIFEKL